MSKPLLQITTVTRGDAFHVVADGELDVSTVPMLADALVAAYSGHAETILLDIEGVGFIDSTGLRALLEAYIVSQQNGNRLRITRGTPQARRLFALAGADTHLPFVDAPTPSTPPTDP